MFNSRNLMAFLAAFGLSLAGNVFAVDAETIANKDAVASETTAEAIQPAEKAATDSADKKSSETKHAVKGKKATHHKKHQAKKAVADAEAAVVTAPISSPVANEDNQPANK